jgi:D-glycero-alpha-D-manno-heptose-7-phosphate kinase
MVISRSSSEVAVTFAGSLNDHARSINRFVEMVDEGLDILSGGRIEDFGHLLDEAWQIKRSLSSAVTTSAVDEAYTLARGAGALGGKLLGAGGI